MGSPDDTMTPVRPYWFMKAYHMGVISWDTLVKAIMDYFSRHQSLQVLSRVVQGEVAKPMNRRAMICFFGQELEQKLSRKGEACLGEDTWEGKLIRQLYEAIVPVMVDRELRRGEAETEFSQDIYGIAYIRGIPWLKRILMAQGLDS